MLQDIENILSDSQAITGTANSTNVIDLSGVNYNSNSPDEAIGRAIKLAFNITETFNTLTSLKVDVNTSNDEAFGSSNTLISQSFALAKLTKGAKLPLPDLPEGALRYIRATYTVTGSNPTTGKVNLALVLGREQNQLTPDYKSN